MKRLRIHATCRPQNSGDGPLSFFAKIFIDTECTMIYNTETVLSVLIHLA